MPWGICDHGYHCFAVHSLRQCAITLLYVLCDVVNYIMPAMVAKFW